MNPRQREFVRQRAGGRCEYCHLPQSAIPSVQFHCEYFRARQHHGSDESSNICFSCRQCNLYKGSNQTAYDPQTDELVTLYNPRADIWDEHFRAEDGLIIGVSPKGRATVEFLQMNLPEYVGLRELITDFDLPTSDA